MENQVFQKTCLKKAGIWSKGYGSMIKPAGVGPQVTSSMLPFTRIPAILGLPYFGPTAI